MRKLLLTATLLLVPAILFAQAQSITIEEAIEIALENNYQLKQAENNLTLSRAQERSALADFFPNLNASASRGRNVGRQFDNTTGDFGDFTINSFSAGINSGITIFNGFNNINSLRAAQHETLSREEQLQRVRENIIFNTASRYLQYLLSEQLLQIAEETLQTSEQQLEQVRAQVEVGARPTVDLLNQESIVAGNELQVVNRRNDLNFSRLQLIRTLQIDPLGDYQFVTPNIDESSAAARDYDLQEMVQLALDNRSDLKSELEGIEVALYNLKSARANYYPTLTLNGSVRTSYNDRNPASYSDQLTDQNISRNLGLSLSIPIFNRLNARTSVQAQQISYKNAQLSLENTRLNVIQEVNQAYNDYIALVQELESSEKAFIAAERAYETEQQRYEVGASTLIELSQANNSFVEAQSNRIQTLYNFFFQEKLLDYYIGRLDRDIQF
ncbi:MAG: TolC family protein [Balneolaceae bacterium]|nr:TolC family protein [Balneolaceae bacterium]